MSDHQLRALRIYTDLMTANGMVRAYKAAAELGILRELAQGQRTADQIAEKLGLDRDATVLVLETLCPGGAIERYGDDYALSPALRLLGADAEDLGDADWDELLSLASNGQRSHRANPALTGERAARYRALAVRRQWSMTPSALELRRLMRLDDEKPRAEQLQLLDLGAGSGVWSMAIAYYDPQCHVTLVDIPDVLPLAVQTAHDIGLAERISTIEGSHLEAELPKERFDLALVANVLHQYDDDDSRRILVRARDALKPGGRLAVVDIAAGQPEGDALRTQQALQIALQTPGRVRSVEQLLALLNQAGFESAQFSMLAVAPHTLGALVARRSTAS